MKFFGGGCLVHNVKLRKESSWESFEFPIFPKNLLFISEFTICLFHIPHICFGQQQHTPKCQFSWLTLKNQTETHEPTLPLDLGCDCSQGKHCCVLMLAPLEEPIKGGKSHGPCGSHHIPGTHTLFCPCPALFKGHSSWFSLEKRHFCQRFEIGHDKF